MSDHLTRAILAFETRKGSNGSQTQHLIEDLHRDFSGKPQQDPYFLNTRTAYIADKIQAYFSGGTPHFKPLDSGNESLVIACNHDYILKMRYGIQYRQSHIPADIVLQPIMQHYNKPLHISFEIFPKAKTGLATPADIQNLKKRCLRSGYYFFDAIPQNVGFITQADQTEQPIIIDSGAVFSLNHPGLYYRALQKVTKPLYAKMPFVHPLWQSFKHMAKDMLYPSKTMPDPTQTPRVS